MKKSFTLLCLVLFFAVGAQAQLTKGTTLIGTSSNLSGNLTQLVYGGGSNNAGLQFGKNKTKVKSNGTTFSESETTITSINLNPSVGYFVSDKVMVGLSLGVFSFNEKDEDDDEFGFTAFSISPNLRCYFKNEGNVLPFGELRGGIISLKIKNADETESAPFLGAKFGAAFLLNPHISLDLFADYTYGWDKTEDGGVETKDTQGFFGLGVGLSMFLSPEEK